MPKFAIIITQDNFGWWHYMLVIEHKPIPNGETYANSDSAFKAAKNAANLRRIPV